MNRGDYERLVAMVKIHEGLRLHPYVCPTGHLSIGYGRNLQHLGISRLEAEYLLTNDLNRALAEATSFPWFQTLNGPRRAAICDLIFNMGRSRFAGFKKTIAALERGDYERAAREILDSKYAKQVGQRAVRIAAMIQYGQWGDA